MALQFEGRLLATDQDLDRRNGVHRMVGARRQFFQGERCDRDGGVPRDGGMDEFVGRGCFLFRFLFPSFSGSCSCGTPRSQKEKGKKSCGMCEVAIDRRRVKSEVKPL